jgi:hypothetical protein
MQAMARPTYAAITNYVGDGKPAILFVPTRKHARITAMDMLTFAAADGKSQRFLQVSPPLPFLVNIEYSCESSTRTSSKRIKPWRERSFWGQV